MKLFEQPLSKLFNQKKLKQSSSIGGGGGYGSYISFQKQQATATTTITATTTTATGAHGLEAIPEPIRNLLSELYSRGPSTVGIFRKSPNAKHCKELKHKLESGQSSRIGEFQVTVIASVFKEWLRSLPDCLLMSRLYPQWIDVAKLIEPLQEQRHSLTQQQQQLQQQQQQLQHQNHLNHNQSHNQQQQQQRRPTMTSFELLERRSECLRFVRLLLGHLNESNLILLRSFISVLALIASNSDENKMSAENLGVCVGQSLLNDDHHNHNNHQQQQHHQRRPQHNNQRHDSSWSSSSPLSSGSLSSSRLLASSAAAKFTKRHRRTRSQGILSSTLSLSSPSLLHSDTAQETAKYVPILVAFMIENAAQLFGRDIAYLLSPNKQPQHDHDEQQQQQQPLKPAPAAGHHYQQRRTVSDSDYCSEASYFGHSDDAAAVAANTTATISNNLDSPLGRTADGDNLTPGGSSGSGASPRRQQIFVAESKLDLQNLDHDELLNGAAGANLARDEPDNGTTSILIVKSQSQPRRQLAIDQMQRQQQQEEAAAAVAAAAAHERSLSASESTSSSSRASSSTSGVHSESPAFSSSSPQNGASSSGNSTQFSSGSSNSSVSSPSSISSVSPAQMDSDAECRSNDEDDDDDLSPDGQIRQQPASQQPPPTTTPPPPPPQTTMVRTKLSAQTSMPCSIQVDSLGGATLVGKQHYHQQQHHHRHSWCSVSSGFSPSMGSTLNRLPKLPVQLSTSSYGGEAIIYNPKRPNISSTSNNQLSSQYCVSIYPHQLEDSDDQQQQQPNSGRSGMSVVPLSCSTPIVQNQSVTSTSELIQQQQPGEDHSEQHRLNQFLTQQQQQQNQNQHQQASGEHEQLQPRPQPASGAPRSSSQQREKPSSSGGGGLASQRATALCGSMQLPIGGGGGGGSPGYSLARRELRGGAIYPPIFSSVANLNSLCQQQQQQRPLQANQQQQHQYYSASAASSGNFFCSQPARSHVMSLRDYYLSLQERQRQLQNSYTLHRHSSQLIRREQQQQQPSSEQQISNQQQQQRRLLHHHHQHHQLHPPSSHQYYGHESQLAAAAAVQNGMARQQQQQQQQQLDENNQHFQMAPAAAGVDCRQRQQQQQTAASANNIGGCHAPHYLTNHQTVHRPQTKLARIRQNQFNANSTGGGGGGRLFVPAKEVVAGSPAVGAASVAAAGSLVPISVRQSAMMKLSLSSSSSAHSSGHSSSSSSSAVEDDSSDDCSNDWTESTMV